MDCTYADGQKMLITKKKKCEKAWLEKNSLVLLHIRMVLFCLFCPPDECRVEHITQRQKKIVIISNANYDSH